MSAGTAAGSGAVFDGQAQPDPAAVEHLIREAIEERRLVSFVLKGCRRLAEPHDFGIADGVLRLFFYQVDGCSLSKHIAGWRWATVAKIGELHVLDDHFPGSRTAPSSRLHRWDKLLASVSPR